MRTFLLSVFWVSNIGSVIQLLVLLLLSFLVVSGSYSFAELSFNTFVNEVVPWLSWMKTLVLAVFGEFGQWMLTVPMLIITPLKLIVGMGIGLWAYSVARKMPANDNHPR